MPSATRRGYRCKRCLGLQRCPLPGEWGTSCTQNGSLANDQDPPNTHRCAAQPTVVSKQRRQGTGMSQLAARCWLIWNTYPSVSLACGHGGWHAVCAWRERSGRSKPGPGPSKVLQKSCTIYELIHYPTTHIVQLRMRIGYAYASEVKQLMFPCANACRLAAVTKMACVFATMGVDGVQVSLLLGRPGCLLSVWQH